MSNLRFKLITAMFGGSLFVFAGTPAMTADFGGDCCADLEERIATLEATAARKGNRKVSLTVSGHVNQAILLWDDGHDSDAYVVGNANDDLAMFRFEGDAKISSGWSAGYLIELELTNTASADVSQLDDDGENELAISESSMYIESEQFGKLTWGFAGQPSDGAPEMDLSGAHYAGYAAVADVAGGFQWRLANGAFSGITLGDVFDDLNGDTFDIIRYDTPTIAGFTLSAAWGEDDLWDVALTYENELGDFEVAAAIAYTENTDDDEDNNPVSEDTIAGSVSVLHAPTGLNLTFAAGQREFNNEPLRDEATFYYVKAGLFQRYNSLGKTAIYGEYGQFNDMFFVNGADGVDEQAIITALGGGANGVINGSEANVWGVGLVQYVDAAAMQLYVAYRHYDVDFDLVNAGGAGIAANGADDFDSVLAGGRIEF